MHQDWLDVLSIENNSLNNTLPLPETSQNRRTPLRCISSVTRVQHPRGWHRAGYCIFLGCARSKGCGRQGGVVGRGGGGGLGRAHRPAAVEGRPGPARSMPEKATRPPHRFPRSRRPPRKLGRRLAPRRLRSKGGRVRAGGVE